MKKFAKVRKKKKKSRQIVNKQFNKSKVFFIDLLRRSISGKAILTMFLSNFEFRIAESPSFKIDNKPSKYNKLIKIIDIILDFLINYYYYY